MMGEASPEISLAPMLKVTTPYFRLLIRKLSPETILFTEMIVDKTVIHATDEKIKLILGSAEDKTVVQLGGSEPAEVSQAVSRLQRLGWQQFNLNCGCPSERVQNGKFGAVLMLEKENVCEIINRVYRDTGAILSLKTRTGVDENDSYEFFKGFVECVSRNTPCFKFYVHARKCWLKGLNPKKNRTVPPLSYGYVYDIKEEYPHLFFSLNGGIVGGDREKVKNLDGLMIGRWAWEDIEVFCKYENRTADVKRAIREYLEEAAQQNPPKHKVMNPLINYCRGRATNKAFRKVVNEIVQRNTPISEIFGRIEPFLL